MTTKPTLANVQDEIDALVAKYPALTDLSPDPSPVDLADLFLEHGAEVAVAFDRLYLLRSVLSTLQNPDE